MNGCIAVFASRTQVMEFIEYMNYRGINARPVSTPAEARIGCGTSAYFPCGYINYARELANAYGLDSFKGFYKVERQGFKTSVTRL